ncbi:unnamed protein product [Larinioides sclopetarius]|uniref:Uncharacterized protein n=1 Tax=Larinioides sclopetarius TaxID=280406 RepID=A0AAV2BGM8_9ARAC
MFASSVIKHLP